MLDHDGLGADAGHKVDGVRPELAASGGAVVDGSNADADLRRAARRELDPCGGRLHGGGGRSWARTVTRVAVRGATVELTLDSGAEHLKRRRSG